jgi:glucose-1-phosphate adenylyltransferase
LIDHIQTGESWGLYGKNRGAVILPPYTGNDDSSWYAGTADAIYQNLNYINKFDDIDRVLILSGDHIYKMDYSELIKFHTRKKADVTIVSMEVPIEDASRFGTIIVDEHDRVVDFEEKPKNPKSNLVSLGIYVFNKDVLVNELKKDAMDENSNHDFGQNILPNNLDKNILVYRFKGYWKDVGTIDSYWETSMDLLDEEAKKNKMNFDQWKITTNFNRLISADRNPAYISETSSIKNSLISEGCIIEGEVENSILSPGVKIEKDAFVKDSIIFHDTVIGKSAEIDRAIIDKNVTIGENSTIGINNNLPGKENEIYPTHLSSGITIVGKSSIIPKNISLGRNCIVQPDLIESDFENQDYPDGKLIKKRLY